MNSTDMTIATNALPNKIAVELLADAGDGGPVILPEHLAERFDRQP